jgi:hypothetical protein
MKNIDTSGNVAKKEIRDLILILFLHKQKLEVGWNTVKSGYEFFKHFPNGVKSGTEPQNHHNQFTKQLTTSTSRSDNVLSMYLLNLLRLTLHILTYQT